MSFLKEVSNALDKITEMLQKGLFREDFSITHIDKDPANFSEATKDKDEALPKSILVTVEAIHAGMTKNKTFYPADKLEASMHTWTTPHEKPVIKNHDTWEEPNGRVKEANFRDSLLKPETKTIELKLKIMDPDVIEKVLDGRYQTLSIGGATNEARCSICAKNVVTEGWCGHSKGKSYEGKEAYWIIGDMEFNEISWVNVPADVNARVVSIQKEEATAGGRKESVDGTDLIDNILNENEQTPPADPGTPDTPITEGANTPDGTLEEGKDGADAGAGATPEKTDAEKLTEALDQITVLEGTVTTLTDERDTLKTEKDALDNTVAENASEITLLKEERDSFRNKNITLAKAAHRYLAERAVDLRVILGEATKDERDSLITEYAKTPAKVLESTIKDLLDKPATAPEKPRESTPIASPGAVQTEGAHSSEDGDISESANGSGKPAEVDINVLAERMIAMFTKQN